MFGTDELKVKESKSSWTQKFLFLRCDMSVNFTLDGNFREIKSAASFACSSLLESVPVVDETSENNINQKFCLNTVESGRVAFANVAHHLSFAPAETIRSRTD